MNTKLSPLIDIQTFPGFTVRSHQFPFCYFPLLQLTLFLTSHRFQSSPRLLSSFFILFLYLFFLPRVPVTSFPIPLLLPCPSFPSRFVFLFVSLFVCFFVFLFVCPSVRNSKGNAFLAVIRKPLYTACWYLAS